MIVEIIKSIQEEVNFIPVFEPTLQSSLTKLLKCWLLARNEGVQILDNAKHFNVYSRLHFNKLLSIVIFRVECYSAKTRYNCQFPPSDSTQHGFYAPQPMVSPINSRTKSQGFSFMLLYYKY